MWQTLIDRTVGAFSKVSFVKYGQNISRGTRQVLLIGKNSQMLQQFLQFISLNLELNQVIRLSENTSWWKLFLAFVQRSHLGRKPHINRTWRIGRRPVWSTGLFLLPSVKCLRCCAHSVLAQEAIFRTTMKRNCLQLVPTLIPTLWLFTRWTVRPEQLWSLRSLQAAASHSNILQTSKILSVVEVKLELTHCRTCFVYED